MSLRRSRIAAIALGACAVMAVPALAAPDHTAVLGNSNTTFNWDGAAQVSAGVPEPVRSEIPCDTPVARACEDVLFEIKDPGKLTVKVDGGPGGPPNDDVDVRIYKSDKDGTAEGDPIAEGIAAGPDNVSAKVTPGFYLAQVDYYRAKQTGYKGSATFAGSAPAAPVVPPTVTPPGPNTAEPEPGPSASDKKKAKRKKCQKKAKRIKNAKKRKAALKKCAKAGR